VAAIFPELDFVDHKRRKELAAMKVTPELITAQCEFRPIEAILILGEPVSWECALQVIIDLLMTNGDPRSKFKFVPSPHLPIIACNKDLTFKGPAPLPRFGNGAFLECLEALYMVNFNLGN
jgi:ribonucleotide monophosphatase NagD (HAD superfamily)